MKTMLLEVCNGMFTGIGYPVSMQGVTL